MENCKACEMPKYMSPVKESRQRCLAHRSTPQVVRTELGVRIATPVTSEVTTACESRSCDEEGTLPGMHGLQGVVRSVPAHVTIQVVQLIPNETNVR